MKAIAIAFAIFSLFMITRLFRAFRRGRLGTPIFLLWSVIWIGFSIFALFPDLLDLFMHWTMMTKRMNFALVIAVFFLLVMVNMLFVSFLRQQRTIRKLSQEHALLRYAIEHQTKAVESNRLEGNKDERSDNRGK